MVDCAKLRGINYVASTGKDVTKELPRATNRDDPHGCDVPVITGKPSSESFEGRKNKHVTAGPCRRNMPSENGLAVCGARTHDENYYSIDAAECIETTCADGFTRHKDEEGKRTLPEENALASTNTRGPIFDHPEYSEEHPKGPPSDLKNTENSKVEPPTFPTANKSTNDGILIAEASDIISKRPGAIHVVDCDVIAERTVLPAVVGEHFEKSPQVSI